MLFRILQVENRFFAAETVHFQSEILKIVILHKSDRASPANQDIFA